MFVKRVLSIVVVMLCVSMDVRANSADRVGDPSTAISSANPLFNILRQELPSNKVTIYGDYIPEYGLQMNSWVFLDLDSSPVSFKLLVSNLAYLIETFAPSVEGLAENDWVSFSALVFVSPIKYITVRVKPNTLESLKVWIDGEKQ